MELIKSFKELSILQKMTFIAIILLLLLVVFNFINLMQFKTSINEKLSSVQQEKNVEIKQQRNPVKAVIISATNCSKCFDLDQLIQALQQANIVFSDIQKFDYKSEEAKKFIEKFSIKKAPVILLSKDIASYDIAKDFSKVFPLKDDFYVVEDFIPYIEVNTGNLKGVLSLINITDETCLECFDVNNLKILLEKIGLVFDEPSYFDLNSAEGKALIERYAITKVPTIVLQGDTSVYQGFDELWLKLGSIESDKSYVFRNFDVLNGITYKDLNSNEVIRSGEDFNMMS